jgi:GntR family transcriptional regulator/MocR family aminotransferase
MLMPGLRVGFVAADGPIYDSLIRYKHVNDLATSNLIQYALEAYVTVGRYQAHLRRSCQLYHKRRDAMLAAINRYLPPSVRVNPPQGGLFIWLRLPDPLSSEDLLPLACEQGVNFTPGDIFFPEGTEDDHCLRLNFVIQPPDEIEEGIKRLGKAIKCLAVK